MISLCQTTQFVEVTPHNSFQGPIKMFTERRTELRFFCQEMRLDFDDLVAGEHEGVACAQASVPLAFVVHLEHSIPSEKKSSKMRG